MDYKDTLNLPVTDFPMKANLVKREPEILERWEKKAYTEKSASRLKGERSTFFMMVPLCQRAYPYGACSQ